MFKSISIAAAQLSPARCRILPATQPQVETQLGGRTLDVDPGLVVAVLGHRVLQASRNDISPMVAQI